MGTDKSLESRKLGRVQSLLPLLFVLAAAVFQLFSPEGRCAVCQTLGQSGDNSDLDLTRAREQVESTLKSYETVKRLSEQGSVSQHVLRRSNLRRKIALLDYSSLLDPSRREKNQRLRAEVILQFHSQESEVMQKLFQKGSVSKVEYLRSVAARDIADSYLKAVKSASQTQRKMQSIKAANVKFELAQKEYEIATRLFDSQAISRSSLDRANSNLRIAETELQAAKQSLGARAVQVRQ